MKVNPTLNHHEVFSFFFFLNVIGTHPCTLLGFRFACRMLPMGEFFDIQFDLAFKFQEVEYQDKEIAALSGIIIMNPGTEILQFLGPLLKKTPLSTYARNVQIFKLWVAVLH